MRAEKEEPNLKQIKKIGSFLQNCIELYIPAISFAVLFVLFCFQIIVRYIISKFTGLVVPWTVEIEQTCFLWVALLGACYVQRNRGHVVFTLVYDGLGVKGKACLSLISSALVSFACAITLIPSVKYVWGLMARQQVTSLLKIPKTVVFFPYVIFTVLILAYGLIEVFEAIMALAGNEYYTNKLIQSTKSEAEQAVDTINAQKEELAKHANAAGVKED